MAGWAVSTCARLAWVRITRSWSVSSGVIDTRRDAIVAVAAIPFVDGEPRDGYVTLVNPGRPIPAPSTAIHGITDADGSRPHFVRWLQENMPDVAASWKKLDDAFYVYWGTMPYEMPG